MIITSITFQRREDSIPEKGIRIETDYIGGKDIFLDKEGKEIPELYRADYATIFLIDLTQLLQ